MSPIVCMTWGLATEKVKLRHILGKMSHQIIIIGSSKTWCGGRGALTKVYHMSAPSLSVHDNLVWQQKSKDVSSQVKDLGQICCCYEAVALAVENSKSLANFLLDVGIFELPDLSSTKGQT